MNNGELVIHVLATINTTGKLERCQLLFKLGQSCRTFVSSPNSYACQLERMQRFELVHFYKMLVYTSISIGNSDIISLK